MKSVMSNANVMLMVGHIQNQIEKNVQPYSCPDIDPLLESTQRSMKNLLSNFNNVSSVSDAINLDRRIRDLVADNESAEPATDHLCTGLYMKEVHHGDAPGEVVVELSITQEPINSVIRRFS